MIKIRYPEETDWITIARLADESVTHVSGAPSQGDWVQLRRQFEGVRRHCIAENEGRVVGYGCIEKGNNNHTDEFRLFLVLRWLDKDSTRIAVELLKRLRQDEKQLGIEYLWVREYAEDRPFIEFLLSCDFEVTKEYEFGGHMLVNLRATERFLAT